MARYHPLVVNICNRHFFEPRGAKETLDAVSPSGVWSILKISASGILLLNMIPAISLFQEKEQFLVQGRIHFPFCSRSTPFRPIHGFQNSSGALDTQRNWSTILCQFFRAFGLHNTIPYRDNYLSRNTTTSHS